MKSGHLMEYAIWHPEAVALSSLRADKVADALLGIFTELLGDQGLQFVSNLMQDLCKHIMTSPYHGLCKHFSKTLKQMLVESQVWNCLFAYREVSQ